MLEQIDLRMRQSMHFVFQNRRQLTPIDIQRVCIIFSLCISLKFIEKVQTTYHVAYLGKEFALCKNVSIQFFAKTRIEKKLKSIHSNLFKYIWNPK